MRHHLYMYQRNKGFIPTQLELWYSHDDFVRLNKAEYWFVLHTDDWTKIAECAVYRYGNILPCLPWGGTHFQLTDIWVDPAFRGQSYCSLLLLNVMDYLTRIRDPRLKSIRGLFHWSTHVRNLPARRAFRKLGVRVSRDRYWVDYCT